LRPRSARWAASRISRRGFEKQRRRLQPDRLSRQHRRREPAVAALREPPGPDRERGYVLGPQSRVAVAGEGEPLRVVAMRENGVDVGPPRRLQAGPREFG
jgi:hypothetical protein